MMKHHVVQMAVPSGLYIASHDRHRSIWQHFAQVQLSDSSPSAPGAMEELARQSGPGLSIAAVCAQGTGHLLPILNICTELSKRGHKVKVYMPDFDKENTEKLTRKSGSEFVPLDSQGNTEEGVKEKANKIGTIQFLLWEEIMSPALRSEFSKSALAHFDICYLWLFMCVCVYVCMYVRIYL